MSTLTPGVFTYSEWAMRMDQVGNVATLVNLLSQENGILADMLAVPCQNGNAFEFTQVTSLPSPTRRAYNQGITPTIATVGKQIQTCVEYDDTVLIDQSLARLNGNLNELRAQEDFLHMQGMTQQIASDLFYSNNSTNPMAFTGLANIYNTVSTSTSQIANNVINCGGTASSNASMWLITWGPKQIHTIFPNGLPAGLQHLDKGLQRVYDANAKAYYAYETWLQWNIGIAIHDWRFAARACNIDVTQFGGGSAANLIAILAALVMKPPVMPAGAGPVQTSDDPRVQMGRSAIYVNRTVYLALDLQAQDKTNVLLRMEEWDGHTILAYRGIPIRIVDKLTNSETVVT